jgi:hypothetical protein
MLMAINFMLIREEATHGFGIMLIQYLPKEFAVQRLRAFWYQRFTKQLMPTYTYKFVDIKIFNFSAM